MARMGLGIEPNVEYVDEIDFVWAIGYLFRITTKERKGVHASSCVLSPATLSHWKML